MEDKIMTEEIKTEIYYFEELYNILRQNKEIDEEIDKKLREYNGETIIKNNIKKQNTNTVLENIVKENVIKTKITQILNKLHNGNIPSIIKQIKEINYMNVEDLVELSNQLIGKIKRDNDQVKQIVGDLIYELLTICVVENETKNYLHKILLRICRNEYNEVIRNIKEDEYNRERNEKIMNMLIILFNSNVIESKIVIKIIEEISKYMESERGMEAERAIQMFNIIISSLIMNNENKKMIEGLDKYIEGRLKILEKERKIGKMMIIMGENIIEKIRN
jgi:hypothetical protein